MKQVQFLGIRLFIWTVVIFILCTMPMPNINIDTPARIPHADKIVHFGLFFLFSLFAYSWLQAKKLKHIFLNILIVVILVVIYGGAIEWIQGRFFQRTADLWDWFADILGGVLGVLSYPCLHNLKQKVTLCFRRSFIKKSS